MSRKFGLWKVGLHEFSESWAPTFWNFGLQRKFGLYVKKAEYWAPEEFWALSEKIKLCNKESVPQFCK